MTTCVKFEVVGIPAPQGSKSAFTAKSGASITKESGGLKFSQWRNAVSEAALRQAEIHGTLDGALTLWAEFTFPMPQSRPKKIRALGRVPKTTSPDLSKLVRAIEDAMQAAGLIRDDARIAFIAASKWEDADGPHGVTIELRDGAGETL